MNTNPLKPNLSKLSPELLQSATENFFNQSTELHCIANFDRFFLALNHRWTQILGWSKEELSSKPYTDFVHPEDLKITQSEGDYLAIDPWANVSKFINRYRHKEGHYITLEWEARTDKNLGIVYASARDITEKRRYELDAEKQGLALNLLSELFKKNSKNKTIDEYFKHCIDKISKTFDFNIGHLLHCKVNPFGIAILESKQLWYFSDEAKFPKFRHVSESISFAPGEGIPGMAYLQGIPLLVPSIAEMKNCPRLRLVKAKYPIKSAIALPILDPRSNTVIYVLEFYTEEIVESSVLSPVFLNLLMKAIGDGLLGLKEEKKIKNEPIIRTEHLRQVLHCIDENFILSATDSQGKINFVNQKFCEISGYSQAELLGQDHRILNSRFHDKAFFADMWATINAGKSWKGEILNRAKDGREYWVQSVITPAIDHTGKISHFLSLRIDITEQKRMQNSLKAADRSEGLVTMANGLAHEINNPLAIIKGRVDLLSKLVKNKKIEERKIEESCESISVATQRISHIVKLFHSLAENPAELGLQEVFSVHKLLEDSIEICISTLREKNIQWKIQPFLDEGHKVKGNQQKLSQLLVYLIHNSIDAIEAEPKKWIHAEIKDLGNEVEISLTDSGNGISAEVKKRLFTPLYTSKAPGKGRGLGLSIAQSILRQHGSLLSLDETCPNTKFIFSLKKTE